MSDQSSHLREQMRRVWPMMTWRDIGDVPRTIVVCHSVSVYLPPAWQPLLPAYEERYLCFILGLAARGTRVVYVTSMPVLPRLVDYWFGLVPELDTPETRSRLTLVSVVDPRPIPLSRKLLEHPGAVERIRAAIADPRWAAIMGHMVGDDDLELARMLDVPVYGPTPAVAEWGTKTGSRRAFRAAGVASAPGVDGVRTRADVLAAVATLREQVPEADAVIVKHDEGVSGIGNGTLPLDGDAVDLDRLVLEETTLTVDDFYAHLAREGGVVEVFLRDREVRSPSVQLRISPDGETDILSTHEQILGGPHGLTYVGCSMPADPAYALLMADQACAIGNVLAEHGVLGRFAIDFLAHRGDGEWQVRALEINLRQGGTTHPWATLTALCGGGYDPETAGYVTAGGDPKFYKATDHLHSPAYASLTTDDLLDVLQTHGLGWDRASQTGTVVHMASAIASMGAIGVTAIADSPAEAATMFEDVRGALDAAAADHSARAPGDLSRA